VQPVATRAALQVETSAADEAVDAGQQSGAAHLSSRVCCQLGSAAAAVEQHGHAKAKTRQLLHSTVRSTHQLLTISSCWQGLGSVGGGLHVLGVIRACGSSLCVGR